MNLNLPKLIGHRGVRDIAPENTIFSIEKAINYNLKWIEVDVKISKDKIPILLHDNTLERTTSGKGSPINFSYNEISKFDAGKWFDRNLKNIYVPTLDEVLKLCSKKEIGINIELKPNKGFEKDNVKAIVKLFKQYKKNLKFYFSSFDWESIILIKKLFPKSNVGLLIDKFDIDIEKIIKKCKKYKIFSCGLNIKIINKKVVLLLKNNNIHISVYSSKSITYKISNKLFAIGIDSIFIDNPKAYKNLLNI